MKILIDEPNTKLQLNEESRIIELSFLGEIETTDYQFAYNHLLTYAEIEQISSFIINETKSSTSIEAITWRFSVFFPKLVAKVGTELDLVFITRDGSTNLKLKYLRQFLEKISKRLKLSFSRNEESARQFLIEKRKDG